MGTKLKYSQPILLDDVAADFPELKIISAHPTWPWTAESLAIARQKSNYFIDLPGWAPKYFPAELVHNVNTLLQDKVMFGSDWPAIGVERWLEEFQQMNIKPEVRQKVMLDNAKKFFNLNFSGDHERQRSRSEQDRSPLLRHSQRLLPRRRAGEESADEAVDRQRRAPDEGGARGRPADLFRQGQPPRRWGNVANDHHRHGHGAEAVAQRR